MSTIFAIRDNTSRLGLNTQEVAFMLIVESHGEAFATAQTLASEMGMGRSTFYKVRDRLVSRGLVQAVTRGHQTTVYRVNPDALVSTEIPVSETTGVSVGDGGVSHATGGSVVSETLVSLRQHTEEVQEEVQEKNKEDDPAPLFASQDLASEASGIPTGTDDASEASGIPTGTDDASEASGIPTESGPFGAGTLGDLISQREATKAAHAAYAAEREARWEEAERYRERYRAEESAPERVKEKLNSAFEDLLEELG